MCYPLLIRRTIVFLIYPIRLNLVLRSWRHSVLALLDWYANTFKVSFLYRGGQCGCILIPNYSVFLRYFSKQPGRCMISTNNYPADQHCYFNCLIYKSYRRPLRPTDDFTLISDLPWKLVKSAWEANRYTTLGFNVYLTCFGCSSTLILTSFFHNILVEDQFGTHLYLQSFADIMSSTGIGLYLEVFRPCLLDMITFHIVNCPL